MKKEKITIGRLDYADLPDLGLKDIRIKIDTGAYTSSLHCKKMKIKVEEGIQWLSFKIQGSSKTGVKAEVFKTKDFTTKEIKSSNGQIQKRHVIKTRIKLYGKYYKTEFSLTDRSSMKNPILIGRKLLSKKFIVDVSQKDLSYKKKSKEL
jgi:hypothetical protein